MARLIKYKSQCYKCLKTFEKGQAYLTLRKNEHGKSSWRCHCFACYTDKQLDSKIRSEMFIESREQLEAVLRGE